MTGVEAQSRRTRMEQEIREEDPSAEAIGPVFVTDDLAKWLGSSRQAIEDLRRQLGILAMVTADGYWVYPAWQFDEHGQVRKGVGEAVRALTDGGADSWTEAL